MISSANNNEKSYNKRWMQQQHIVWAKIDKLLLLLLLLLTMAANVSAAVVR